MASSEGPEIIYSCEVCGQEGLTDEEMRAHMRTVHIQGAVQCPFCDLSDVTTNEMTLHVNSAHLEYLTPEREDISFLEDENVNDFNSIWELEKEAKEGLTNGVTKSPTKTKDGNSSNNPCIHSARRASSSNDSPMSTGTEFSSTFGDDVKNNANNSVSSSPCHSVSSKSSSSCNGGAVQKKPRKEIVESFASPSKANLTLNIKPISTATATTTATTAMAAETSAYSCPICNYSENDVEKLQEHVNRNHFDDFSSPGTTNKSFPCPLCTKEYTRASELELHVNREHGDVLSPADSTPTTTSKIPSFECPVCFLKSFHNENDLAAHVDAHFNGSVKKTSNDNDYLLAQELERRERERRKLDEQKEFEQLRAQYGMDNEGNFRQQSLSNMQKAVYTGEMSVVDYYERQFELKQSERSGMDDGRSVTFNIIPSLKTLSEGSRDVETGYFCSYVDHYSSSFGDKGWGCGYRNLQILLSSLAHDPRISLDSSIVTPGQRLMPSIGKLQELIEKAWAKGFDVKGSDQLGGKLRDTRKWIGATELVAFFSSIRIRTELLDFHQPSAKDGTHPALFQWVTDYFRNQKEILHPLYLQHQGHSRTIVGVEILAKNGGVRFLVIDPSHSRASMSSGLSGNPVQVMRMLRKIPLSIKSRQYQIVAVTGVFNSDQEAATQKYIKSKRIS